MGTKAFRHHVRATTSSIKRAGVRACSFVESVFQSDLHRWPDSPREIGHAVLVLAISRKEFAARIDQGFDGGSNGASASE
jgi:hypothetical protein